MRVIHGGAVRATSMFLAACENGPNSVDSAVDGRELPVGPPDSEYRVAGNLPGDLRLIAAREQLTGRGPVAHHVEYQPGVLFSDSAAGFLTVAAVTDGGDQLQEVRGGEPATAPWGVPALL